MALPAIIAGALGSSILGQANQAMSSAQSLGWNTANQKVLGNIRNEQMLDLISKQPQAYMAGLEQAGLNPILATGSAPNMAGGSSAQQATAAQVDPTKQAKASALQTRNFIYFLKALKKL